MIDIKNIETSPANQMRTVMYDPKHSEAIRVSLKDCPNPESVLPPIVVEPVMGTDKYTVIDGHHRLEALRQMGCKQINADVMRPKSEAEKAILGFELNCTDKPQKAAGMSELEVALSKLHTTGTDITDPELQREFADRLNHSNTIWVARVANKIIEGQLTEAVDVVPLSDIEERIQQLQSEFVIVKQSQSTKVSQGLGGLLMDMATSNAVSGILLIYFKDGVEKKRYDDSRIVDTITEYSLPITVEYMN